MFLTEPTRCLTSANILGEHHTQQQFKPEEKVGYRGVQETQGRQDEAAGLSEQLHQQQLLQFAHTRRRKHSDPKASGETHEDGDGGVEYPPQIGEETGTVHARGSHQRAPDPLRHGKEDFRQHRRQHGVQDMQELGSRHACPAVGGDQASFGEGRRQIQLQLPHNVPHREHTESHK